MSTAASPKYPSLGSRIRDARNGVKLSQEAFADRINTSRRHVMRLERGDHKPSPPMLTRIAEVTGVSESELLNGDAEDEESDAVADLMDAIRRLVRAELQAAA